MENKIMLTDRKNLSITGIKKVEVATENNLELHLEEGALIIQGTSLHINTLNINNGNIEIDGTINLLKFTGKNIKENLFKKVFK